MAPDPASLSWARTAVADSDPAATIVPTIIHLILFSLSDFRATCPGVFNSRKPRSGDATRRVGTDRRPSCVDERRETVTLTFGDPPECAPSSVSTSMRLSTGHT